LLQIFLMIRNTSAKEVKRNERKIEKRKKKRLELFPLNIQNFHLNKHFYVQLP